jgi:hypothetical protein
VARARGAASAGVRGRTAEERGGQGRLGDSTAGSRRGSAGGTGRGGRRRVPAHPAAPARAPLLKAGATRLLPQTWERPESPGNRDERSRRSLRPHQSERDRDAPAAPRPAGSPAGAHFQSRPRPAAPHLGWLNGKLWASLLCQGEPQRPPTDAGAVAKVVTPSAIPIRPQSAGTERPEDEKGQSAPYRH